MTAKNIAAAKDIYQLKVTLLGSKPPIWRRILVPADLTLAKLHGVLQTVMGWYDEHMHEFRASQNRFGRPDLQGSGMRMPGVESEATTTLSAVLRKTGAKMTYTYDFGDSWEHGIVLEKQLAIDPHTTYPLCIDGQLACPPEDCGGIHGYYALLQARTNPRHPRHKELCDWIGNEFSPEAFSVEKVNRHLPPTP